MNPLQAHNLLDRVIEIVSPLAAKSRYAARAQIELAREQYRTSHRGARGARGARSGRFSDPWSRSRTYAGGSAASRLEMAEMCDRANHVYDENVIGGGMLDTETDNIVAEGFSLQMLTDNAAFNDEAVERFYAWLDRADVQGMATGSDLFRDSWREPRKEGDGGFLLVDRGGYPFLQYIQRDRICDPMKIPDGQERREWFDGVRCDGAGRPIGFNVRESDENGRDQDAYVDARDFIFLAPRRIKKDVRGATVYRRIFHHLDQVDALLDATTKAAIMGAIFGLIEKRRNPKAVIDALQTEPNSDGVEQKAVTYENGMVKVIGTDEGVMQVQATQPLPQMPEFVRSLLRIIALAFDMPLEIGLRDLSQVNFSGGRIGLVGYYRSCQVKQDWLKSRCWNRIVFWWLSKEKRRQEAGFSDAFKTKFPAAYGKFELHGREWDYNDPLTEAQADLLEISIGTKDVETACEMKGRDYTKMRKRRLKQLAADRADGIPVVLSNVTRDERQQVTAVDSAGNPIGPAGELPLNGVFAQGCVANHWEDLVVTLINTNGLCYDAQWPSASNSDVIFACVHYIFVELVVTGWVSHPPKQSLSQTSQER